MERCMLVRILTVRLCARSHALHVRVGLAVQDRKGVVKKGLMEECIFLTPWSLAFIPTPLSHLRARTPMYCSEPKFTQQCFADHGVNDVDTAGGKARAVPRRTQWRLLLASDVLLSFVAAFQDIVHWCDRHGIARTHNTCACHDLRTQKHSYWLKRLQQKHGLIACHRQFDHTCTSRV